MRVTVRQWFRLMRVEAWEHGAHFGADGVEVYFRNERPTCLEPGPLRKPIRIYDLIDLQKLLNEGPPKPLDPDFFRYDFHRPGIGITH